MKRVLFIALILSSTLAEAQSKSTPWTDFTKHNYTNLESLSYTLHHTVHFANGTESSRIASIYADTSDFYFNDLEDSTLLRVSDDSLWLIEYAYANISYGPRHYKHEGMNMYYYIRDRYTWNLAKYAPFYFRPGATDLPFALEETKDTIFDGTPCLIIKFSQQISWAYNKETKKNDIPVTDYIWYYCNKDSYWVEKIVVAKNTDGTGRREVFEFKNIQTARKNNLDSTKYIIHNLLYSNYAKYDFTVEDAPSVIGWGGSDTLLSDEVLHFPLVNTLGDTVRLADAKGWILLDFWIYGCRPCASFWTELQQEKDSLGYRRLEHNGIQLFCINNEGGVTQKFIGYANRFHAHDIMYAARGLHFLDTRMTPTYYLFAPNHDLVYHGYSKQIIDTLLDAKKRYEQKAQCQNKEKE